MNYEELINQAIQVKENAYVKYSGFHVGAALLGESGRIYTGCNVENASYGGTICAERTAVVKAISEGEKKFRAIAIVSDSSSYTMPCGICRQFLSEFGLDIKIIMPGKDNIRVMTLSELLPEAFTSDDLEK